MALIAGMQLSRCTESLSIASENAHYPPFWLVSFQVGTTLVLSLCIISLTGTFKLVRPFAMNVLLFCTDTVRTGGFVRTEFKDRTLRFLKYGSRHFMCLCWQQIKQVIALKTKGDMGSPVESYSNEKIYYLLVEFKFEHSIRLFCILHEG